MRPVTPLSTELQEGLGGASCLPDTCGCLVTTRMNEIPLSYSGLERRAFSGGPRPPRHLYLPRPASIFSHVLAYPETEPGRKWGGVDVAGGAGGINAGREGLELCVSWMKVHLWPPTPQENRLGWAVPWTGFILKECLKSLSLN